MPSGQVRLRFTHGNPAVSVREITGREEWSVREASTKAAVDLLTRLVEWPAGLVMQADVLAAPDRDALLASIYADTYGNTVESTGLCSECSSRYDIRFSLDDLKASVERIAARSQVESDSDGTFRTASGVRFRLATARDEIEVSRMPQEEAARALASRCLVDTPVGTCTSNEELLAEVDSALEEVAPMLSVDVSARCPECSAPQQIRFDMQFYLLRALEQERIRLGREIHRIASTYQWSLDDILSLERSERRRLVQLIEADLAARRRS